MPEEFIDVKEAFEASDVFEIDGEENLMKGSAFLKILNKIHLDVTSEIEAQVTSLLDDESIHLEKVESSEDGSIFFELKTLSSKNNQQGWTTKKLKFNFAIEVSCDEPNVTEFKSPLDDIRQSLSNNQG